MNTNNAAKNFLGRTWTQIAITSLLSLLVGLALYAFSRLGERLERIERCSCRAYSPPVRPWPVPAAAENLAPGREQLIEVPPRKAPLF